MSIVVTGNAQQLERWQQFAGDPKRVNAWMETPADLPADAHVLDLSFDGSPERIAALQGAAFCLVNAVNMTCGELPSHFARFNGWPGFTETTVIEAACPHETGKLAATTLLDLFGKRPEWVADIPGFVSARIVAMIINEAFYTLQEDVSTEEAIDTAMKLGTNYPFGPFEWCLQIGAANVYELLHALAETEARYTPAEALKKEAGR